MQQYFNFQSRPITSRYGLRRDPVTGATGKMHYGIDFGLPIGTEITATEDVIIRDVRSQTEGGKLTGAGKYLLLSVVSRPELTFSLFHLSKNDLHAKGATVPAGKVIAVSGNTGKSTGPHLHLETRLNGRRLNPEAVLKGGGKTVRPAQPRLPKPSAAGTSSPALSMAPTQMVVKAGDTVWSLLRARFPASNNSQIAIGVGIVERLNPGVNVGKLAIGQRLTLPVSSQKGVIRG